MDHPASVARVRLSDCTGSQRHLLLTLRKERVAVLATRDKFRNQGSMIV